MRTASIPLCHLRLSKAPERRRSATSADALLQWVASLIMNHHAEILTRSKKFRTILVERGLKALHLSSTLADRLGVVVSPIPLPIEDVTIANKHMLYLIQLLLLYIHGQLIFKCFKIENLLFPPNVSNNDCAIVHLFC